MSQAIVDQVHQQFPALLRANTNETCAAFCYHACLALGGAWRLLSKSGGENGHTWPNGARTSHDAICQVDGAGAKVAVVDIIVGAGSGSTAEPGWGEIPAHEWRASNTPVALSAVPAPGEGTKPTKPAGPVCPDPSLHTKPTPSYPGDRVFDQVGAVLEADYHEAHQRLNGGSATWFARVIWDHVVEGLPLDASVTKHRAEWRAALRLR